MTDEIINYKIFNTIHLSKTYGNDYFSVSKKDIFILFRFDLVIPVIKTYLDNPGLKNQDILKLNTELYKHDHNPARLKNYFNAEIIAKNHNSAFSLSINNFKFKIKYSEIVKNYKSNIIDCITSIITSEFETVINNKIQIATDERIQNIKLNHLNSIIYDRFYVLTKNNFDTIFSEDLSYSYQQSKVSNLSGLNFGFCNILNNSYFKTEITVRLKKINNKFILSYIHIEVESKNSYNIYISSQTVENTFSKYYSVEYDNIDFLNELSNFVNEIYNKLLHKYNESITYLDNVKSDLIQIESDKTNIIASCNTLSEKYTTQLESLRVEYENTYNDLQNKLKDLLNQEKTLKQKLKDSLDLII